MEVQGQLVSAGRWATFCGCLRKPSDAEGDERPAGGPLLLHPHLSVFLSSRLTCECETLENSHTYLMLFLPRKQNLMRMVSFT